MKNLTIARKLTLIIVVIATNLLAAVFRFVATRRR